MIEVAYGSGVQAFGMSITNGASATSSVHHWVNRYGSYIGGTIENRAIGGTGLASMAEQANKYATNGGRTKIGLIDGPLNDVKQSAAAALPSVEPAYNALISTLFTGYSRPASSVADVVRTGTWSALASGYGGRARFWAGHSPMFTTDPAATMEFAFSGPVVVVHGFASETDDWLDMEIEIDGSPWGVTDWEFKARPGLTGKQSAATVIDGLLGGPHTIKIKPPAAGIPSGHSCVVDCFNCPATANPVLLGSIPNIANWAANGSTGTWSDAQVCNDTIEQMAGDWAWRGFPVEFVDLTSFIDPARDFSVDGVHPNNVGQLNWGLGYLASTRLKP